MRQCSIVVKWFLSQYLQSITIRRLIRTRKVQIREDWSSIRLRNQYRSASACWLAREIDRFLIQIFRCLLHSIEIKILNKILILVIFAYIYLRSSRTSSAFVFISSRLSHLFWDFQLQQWFVTISTLQSMNFFAMSIDQENSRFETRLEEDERIVLRACLKISRLKAYLISESSYEN